MTARIVTAKTFVLVFGRVENQPSAAKPFLQNALRCTGTGRTSRLRGPAADIPGPLRFYLMPARQEFPVHSPVILSRVF